MEPPGGAGSVPAPPTCYRHADRETYIRCQRCERPICPDCMRDAAVGFHCPDCVREAARTTRQGRTPYGGVRHGGRPIVTQVLIALNAAVFLVILATGGSSSTVLRHLGLLPRGGIFVDATGTNAVLVDGVAEGAVWQLVTSMFTHVEVWHIFFNMMALYILGPQLELVLGRLRYATLYLLSGLVGSATVYWLAAPSSMTIGASGAVFGLMGALLVVAVKVGGNVSSLVTLIALNAAITVLGAQYISWQGHLGGFVGGVVIGAVMVYPPRERRSMWQAVGVGLVALGVLVAIVARTAVLA